MLDLLKFQRTFIKNILRPEINMAALSLPQGQREVRTGWLSGVAYYDGGRLPFPQWD